MTKNDYLTLKMQNSLQVVYEYYREKFEKDKHKPFLGQQEFFVFLQMYMNIHTVFEKVCDYYNKKFEIVELRDAEGNLISFL
jgi:hypothetical protein